MTAALFLFLLAWDTTSRPVPARSPATPKALTACAAVTHADVEVALGRKIGRGEETNNNGSSTCDYSTAGGQVTITMQRLGASPDLDQEKRSLTAEFPGSTIREARLEGADAFFVDLGADGTLLYAIRGGRDYVMVAILGFGQPAHVSAPALSLAHTALTRHSAR